MSQTLFRKTEIKKIDFVSNEKIQSIDFMTRAHILLNELRAIYVHKTLSKEELHELAICYMETKQLFRWDFYLDHQPIIVVGHLKTLGNDQFEMLDLWLQPKKQDTQQVQTSSENFEEKKKAEATVEDKVESSTEIPELTTSKVDSSMLKLWLIVKQNQNEIKKHKRKEWKIFRETTMMDMEDEQKQYPLLYESNKMIKVIFKDGYEDSFNTEFCAELYALLRNRLSISNIQVIRDFDKDPKSKEKVLQFIKEVKNVDDYELLSSFKIDWIDNALKHIKIDKPKKKYDIGKNVMNMLSGLGKEK